LFINLTSAMTVQFEIRETIDSAELSVLWQELEGRAAPPFFLSWDWIGCWLAEISLRPAVLIGRVEGRIVLLGALVPSTRREPLPIPIHGLHLHATGDLEQDIITIEYNGFLVDSGWAGRIESDAIAYLLSGIKVAGRKRNELHLRNMSAFLEQAAVASGCQFSDVQRKPSWRIDLAETRASGQTYLDRLSANTRQQIRRSMRLYEKRGPLTATRARDVAEAFSFLDGLKQLHQSYWVGRGEPGAFAYNFFERFQKRLIQNCQPRGTVEIIKVSTGTDVIGYVYNLVYRGHVYAYQTGFLYESDARLKPGLVSHYLCTDLHLHEGAQVYDFMAGEARYKANLGNAGPDMLYLVGTRPTWPLRLEGVLKAVFHRLHATE
jgi:CelD/BcsL family acetyltransferase involved in cellulose biosynthesis